MTKYEWESELRKNIHRLPEEEIRRVFEYYTELFEDKIERGGDERNIIMEFGNPIDVADKILAEYNSINPNFDIKKKVDEDYKVKGNTTWTDTKPVEKEPDFFADKAKHCKKAKNDKESKKISKSEGKSTTSTIRVILFVILSILFGGVFIGLVVAMWAVVVSVFVAGLACIIAGLVYVVPTIMTWGSGMYPAMVQLGVCLTIVGAGFLMLFIDRFLAKLSKFLTVSIGKMFKGVLVTKRGEL